MKPFRIAVFAAVLSVAACTASPTGSVRPEPSPPSLSTGTVPAPAPLKDIGAATTSSDTLGRGGSSMGSGN